MKQCIAVIICMLLVCTHIEMVCAQGYPRRDVNEATLAARHHDRVITQNAVKRMGSAPVIEEDFFHSDDSELEISVSRLNVWIWAVKSVHQYVLRACGLLVFLICESCSQHYESSQDGVIANSIATFALILIGVGLVAFFGTSKKVKERDNQYKYQREEVRRLSGVVLSNDYDSSPFYSRGEGGGDWGDVSERNAQWARYQSDKGLQDYVFFSSV